jgi:hypothetical protein
MVLSLSENFCATPLVNSSELPGLVAIPIVKLVSLNGGSQAFSVCIYMPIVIGNVNSARNKAFFGLSMLRLTGQIIKDFSFFVNRVSSSL